MDFRVYGLGYNHAYGYEHMVQQVWWVLTSNSGTSNPCSVG